MFKTVLNWKNKKTEFQKFQIIFEVRAFVEDPDSKCFQFMFEILKLMFSHFFENVYSQFQSDQTYFEF